jgi:hypothetical protein
LSTNKIILSPVTEVEVKTDILVLEIEIMLYFYKNIWLKQKNSVMFWNEIKIYFYLKKKGLGIKYRFLYHTNRTLLTYKIGHPQA